MILPWHISLWSSCQVCCIFSCEEHRSLHVCFSFFCLTPTVLAEEECKGQAELGRVLYDVSQVQPAADDSLHNGAFVLCNPGTSSIPDIDSQTSKPQARVHLHAAAPQDSRGCEAADFCHSENISAISKDKTCMGHQGKRDYLWWMSLFSECSIKKSHTKTVF